MTVQYLTIFEGPERSLHQSNLDLEPVGRIEQPYGPPSFRGNRFTIVLRDLSDAEAADALRRGRGTAARRPSELLRRPAVRLRRPLGRLHRPGLASRRPRARPLARPGRAEPDADRPDDARQKAILRDHWGRWTEAKAALDRSQHAERRHLSRRPPDDFRRAFALIRRDLRSIYFSAYQSHLWNLALGRLIERVTRPEQRIPYAFRTATLPIPVGLDPEQAARLTHRPGLPLAVVPNTARARTSVADLPRRSSPSRGWRGKTCGSGTSRTCSSPRGIAWRPSGRGTGPSSELEDDELYRGRKTLELSFELPRGAYATLIVKRLTDAAGPGGDGDEETEEDDSSTDD